MKPDLIAQSAQFEANRSMDRKAYEIMQREGISFSEAYRRVLDGRK